MSQAPAAWYPQDDGRQRYWDGSAWTEHFAPGPVAREPGRMRTAVSQAVRSAVTVPTDHDPDALWMATGKPLTGLGAGRYKLTSYYLFFEKGMLSTAAQQVPISAVLDVDVKQSMSQKARGVGSVIMHVQRSSGVEVVVLEDIVNFREGQRLINETAHSARLLILRNENTHRYENTHLVGHVGQMPGGIPGLPAITGEPVAVPTAAALVQSSPDPMDQLRKLGMLRDDGILTEEEFSAKKAEILARL